MRVGIFGATGQVGGVMRTILAQREFPVDELPAVRLGALGVASAPGNRLAHALVGVGTALVIAFLAAPIVVLVAVSFTADQFAHFPPNGFSLKWYVVLPSLPGLGEALVLSLGSRSFRQ